MDKKTKMCNCGCGGTCKTGLAEQKLRNYIRKRIMEEIENYSNLEPVFDSISDVVVALRGMIKSTEGEDKTTLINIADYLDNIQYDMSENKN